MNAFILTGGNSRRYGRDKSTLTVNGQTFADRLYQTLLPQFETVTVTGKEKMHPNLPFLKDRDPVQTPMNGILTALQYSDSSWNFIISVDMPAISIRLVESLLNCINDHVNAVIPVADGRSYPTCALYHKDAGETFETAYQQEKYKLLSVVKKLQCENVNADAFRKELINVNTPVEYELLKRILSNNG